MNKKKRILTIVVLLVAIFAVVLIALDCVFVYLFSKTWQEVLTTSTNYIIAGLVVAGVGVWLAMDYRVRVGNRVLKVNVDLENSRWLTKKDIHQNDGFTTVNFEKLNTVVDGIPVAAEVKKDELTVVLRKPIHTLVIGSTGTGKTSSFVSPSIEIISRTKTQPDMVITDPKGELYRKHAESLKNNGYNVHIIDLNSPFTSTRYNLLDGVINKTSRLKNLKIEVVRGKYVIDNKTFKTMEEAERQKALSERELDTQIFIELQDFIYAMYPSTRTNDPIWENGSREFIFAILLGMWEDLRDGYLPEEKFNLFNLYKTITDYSVGECEVVREYLETRDETSRVKSLTNTVLTAEGRTLSSYLTSVQEAVQWLADKGITAITSQSDIHFFDWDEKPNVLFLKIPDHLRTRYKLATLIVSQMYKSLVDKANDNAKYGITKEEELLRHTYFLMDEFGNMPKFSNLDKIVTVGRSRGIFFVPVIQDHNQMDNKYGKEVANTVRSNCPIQIFIGTNDENTRKDFSEKCGKRKIRQISYSETNNASVSTSAQSVPLIYPSELEKLNDTGNGEFGNMIVLCPATYPLKSKITPYFMAKKFYGDKQAIEEARTPNMFDEKKNRYDIKMLTAFIRNDLTAQIATEIAQKEDIEAPKTQDERTTVVAANSIVMQKLNNKIDKYKSVLPAEVYNCLRYGTLQERLDIVQSLLDTNNKSISVVELAVIKQYIIGLIGEIDITRRDSNDG